MATFNGSSQPKPVEVNKFLGLNESVGDTEVKPGEFIYMRNFRITSTYKLQKRTGHTTFIDEVQPTKAIQGMWSGRIGADNVLIYVCNGNVKRKVLPAGATTTIGTMTDAKTNIFYFASKLYFQNGTQYKYYDGSTFGDVTSIAYIPTVLTGATPTLSSSTALEPINQLTGKKKIRYVGDNTTTYKINELNADATLFKATVNGVVTTEGATLTVTRVTGTVVFTTAPPSQADVYIEWEKSSSVTPNLILNNTSSVIFGPGNATTVFMWGNVNFKNRRSFSYPLDASYFPVTNFTVIGSDEYAITDMQPQQSSLLVFKEERAYYSTSSYNTVSKLYDYPVFDLNYAVGNVCPNGVQVLNDTAYSLYSGKIFKWGLTYTDSELSAKDISDRIDNTMNTVDLSQAVTFDYQKDNEFWINVGSEVYIYNYQNDTFYIYDNISANCYLEIDGVVYYGTKDGKIERFDGELSDNGVSIESIAKTGFSDMGAYERFKNSPYMWFSIQPASRTSLSVKCPTNRKNEDDPNLKTFTVGYQLFDFNDIDFGDFSFSTNRNPQPKRIKINAKKYAYIQFIFFNNEVDESLVLLSYKVLTEANSFTK